MIRESDFQSQVIQAAALLGWEAAHFRPAQTSKGWRTPVSGSMGRGWPDLTLVREKDQRIIFAELKAVGGKLSIWQQRVLLVLGSVGEVYVWTPNDWPKIESVLAL